MVKIAQVGYGSLGQGLGKTKDGYTYIVNDNVRTGDVIQVISTSRAGRKFATTGVPLHTFKETSVMGQKIKQEAEAALGNQGKSPEITQSYTGKELGASGSRAKGITLSGKQTPSQYTEETRAGNIAKYLEKNPKSVLSQKSQETFDTYSKKFMK